MADANVKLVGVGGGVAYGYLGPTHHAIEDLALMRALPGMTVLAPGDPAETRRATRAAVRRSTARCTCGSARTASATCCPTTRRSASAARRCCATATT